MREPLVTVGIPFFDEERWLGDAIRSILGQSFEDFELVLVDDGSHDRSLEIARSFRDPRVTVLSDGMRKHLPARLNEIAARSRAPYVARMDADDVSHPERLRRQVELLDASPSCDAAGTWVVWVDDSGEPFGVGEGSGGRRTKAEALEQGVFAHATMLARRSWLLANPYDASLTRAEDRDLWCRTAERSSFCLVPECLYVVRATPRDARFLGDYLRGHGDLRRVIRRHGPDAVGVARTARLLAASTAKSFAMRGIVGLGLEERFVRRRGRPPSDGDTRLASEALEAARQRP